MLTSVKIQKEQSELRSQLAALAGKQTPDEAELRSMDALDKTYQANEVRFRAALVAESEERREAGEVLGDKKDKDYADLVSRFEVRQIVGYFDHGRELSGETAEVVQELRSHGDYKGLPLPWQALERRSGETIATTVPAPVRTADIMDRIFASSVSGQMGVSFLNVDSGGLAYPIVSSAVAAAWQTSETGSVGGPTAFTTSERSVAPDHTLGVQMKITRKAMKQSGAGLESAIRRDLQACMAVELDRVIWLGSGSSGEPNGLLKVGSPSSQTLYGSTITSVGAAASWSIFRAAAKRFMLANAAASPASLRLMFRPEVWDDLDDTLITNTAVSELDRLTKNIPNPVITANALAAPAGSPLTSQAVLTTTVGGVAPAYFATWGAVDLIRDIYSDAASGGLRLTGLVTCDLTGTRAEQIEVLGGIQ